eukprot:scaffold428972_cov52-Prasinocladus_malaysianus.AAC.1
MELVDARMATQTNGKGNTISRSAAAPKDQDQGYRKGMERLVGWSQHNRTYETLADKVDEEAGQHEEGQASISSFWSCCWLSE